MTAVEDRVLMRPKLPLSEKTFGWQVKLCIYAYARLGALSQCKRGEKAPRSKPQFSLLVYLLLHRLALFATVDTERFIDST